MRARGCCNLAGGEGCCKIHGEARPISREGVLQSRGAVGAGAAAADFKTGAVCPGL